MNKLNVIKAIKNVAFMLSISFVSGLIGATFVMGIANLFITR